MNMMSQSITPADPDKAAAREADITRRTSEYYSKLRAKMDEAVAVATSEVAAAADKRAKEIPLPAMKRNTIPSAVVLRDVRAPRASNEAFKAKFEAKLLTEKAADILSRATQLVSIAQTAEGEKPKLGTALRKSCGNSVLRLHA